VPVRSSRGRAAAYRAFWQWPLRSPVRFLLTVGLVLAVGVGVSTGVAALGGPPAEGGSTAWDSGSSTTRTPGTGSAATTSPTASPTALPPVPALTPTTLPLSQAPPAALDVAARWSAAWADHSPGTTSQQWLAGLSSYTTEEYLGVLTGVDPANIPATRVTGEPRPLRVAASSVQVEVPTDALTLLVLVVDTENGWRVAGHDRV
jgi:hypothetical protein